MNTHSLRISLLFLTTALSLACAVPNASFCDSSAACAEGFTCDLEKNRCEASADAGDENSVPPETCAGEGQQCLKAAPDGWSGPMAKAVATNADQAPGCGEFFTADHGLFGAEIIEDGSCSCDCESPTSISCGGATLREWTSASEGSCEQGVCNILGSSCSENSQVLTPGDCTRINSNMIDEPFLRASPGEITGGTCAEPEISGDLASRFGEQTRLCGPEIDASGCALDEVCAPEAPAGFAEGLCIASEGEHECPAGFGYTERTLLFTGIDDSRQCEVGSCGCDAPTGSCGGQVELHNGGVDDDLCVGALATLKRSSSPLVEDNICQSLPATASTARYVIDPANHQCQPTGEAGIVGSAIGTGVTTLCCMP